jgi:hypothetical protein
MNSKAKGASPETATLILEQLSKVFRESLLPMHLTKDTVRGHMPGSLFIDMIRKNVFHGFVESQNESMWSLFGLEAASLLKSSGLGSYQRFQLWHILGELIKHQGQIRESFWRKKVVSKLIKAFAADVESVSATPLPKPAKVKYWLVTMCDITRKTKKLSCDASVLKPLVAYVDQIAGVSDFKNIQSIQNLLQQVRNLVGASEETKAASKRPADEEAVATKPKKAKKNKQ